MSHKYKVGDVFMRLTTYPATETFVVDGFDPSYTPEIYWGTCLDDQHNVFPMYVIRSSLDNDWTLQQTSPPQFSGPINTILKSNPKDPSTHTITPVIYTTPTSMMFGPPPPSDFNEGDIVEDKRTGEQLKVLKLSDVGSLGMYYQLENQGGHFRFINRQTMADEYSLVKPSQESSEPKKHYCLRFAEYKGFTDIFDYCVECNKKRGT